MDRFVNEKDYALLSRDRFTFDVMARNLSSDCRLILSDHENVVLCYSIPPFPIWIWTVDHCDESVKLKVWDLLKANDLLIPGCRFNVKHDLADWMIQKAVEDGISVVIEKNLMAYECTSPIKPSCETDGYLYRVQEADAEELTKLRMAFHAELRYDEQDEASYRQKSKEQLENHVPIFFWKNGEDKTVACSQYTTSDRSANIGLVYTLPEERKKHYASMMVYQITKMALDEGFTPMLYTDADYIASNACYQKIGYEFRGDLCTVMIV